MWNVTGRQEFKRLMLNLSAVDFLIFTLSNSSATSHWSLLLKLSESLHHLSLRGCWETCRTVNTPECLWGRASCDLWCRLDLRLTARGQRFRSLSFSRSARLLIDVNGRIGWFSKSLPQLHQEDKWDCKMRFNVRFITAAPPAARGKLRSAELFDSYRRIKNLRKPFLTDHLFYWAVSH